MPATYSLAGLLALAQAPAAPPCPVCMPVSATRKVERVTYRTRPGVKCFSDPCAHLWAWLCGKEAGCEACCSPVEAKALLKRKATREVPTTRCEPAGP